MLAKSKIAWQIRCVMELKKLTQEETGKIIGISQSKVSNILRGNLSGFSIERLILLLHHTLNQRQKAGGGYPRCAEDHAHHHDLIPRRNQR